MIDVMDFCSDVARVRRRQVVPPGLQSPLFNGWRLNETPALKTLIFNVVSIQLSVSN